MLMFDEKQLARWRAGGDEPLMQIGRATVDANQKPPQLAESFIGKIGNPYRFRSDKLIVKIEFEGGKTCTEALADALCAS